jgi:hypothetical protein
MTRFIWFLAVLLMALGLPCEERTDAAGAPEVSEAQVKAAFLISFPKYVDWPVNSFADTNSPIVVAVFGETDLDGDLQNMLKGKTINGHPLVFKRVTTLEEFTTSGCHVLFICTAVVQRMPDILSKLDGTSVLTVGDSDDFLDNGGVIKLAKRDRKIRLEVNLVAANRAHLKLSSKLLSVADVVQGKPQGGGS